MWLGRRRCRSSRLSSKLGAGAQRCHLGTMCAALCSMLSLVIVLARRALPSCWRLWRWRCWPSARAPARCVPSPWLASNSSYRLCSSPTGLSERSASHAALGSWRARTARSLFSQLRATHSQPGAQRRQATAQHAYRLSLTRAWCTVTSAHFDNTAFVAVAGSLSACRRPAAARC